MEVTVDLNGVLSTKLLEYSGCVGSAVLWRLGRCPRLGAYPHHQKGHDGI